MIRKKLNIILLSVILATIQVQASYLDEIKNQLSSVISDVKEKTKNINIENIKETANNSWQEVKENNTTKAITSSIQSTTSKTIKYIRPDQNQTTWDKTKQIANEGIEFSKDKYKEIIK
jgi:D-mannonate dehydratase